MQRARTASIALVPPDHGLLIVNADDLGLDAATTDAIVTVFRAGRITSATAMVHMPDSRRTAELARSFGLPTGLHLNLTEPFRDSSIPAGVRERQRRAVRVFGSSRLARWVYDPRLRTLVDDCVRDQLESYRELFGGEPTHVDGHHHLQTAPNVVLSRALADVAKLRPTFTFTPQEKPAANRTVRAALNALIRRRFETTDRFTSIERLHPDLGGAGLERLDEARSRRVEVMTHPGWEQDRRALLGGTWERAIASQPLGSYADL
jgi:predicted glycoside hydrolase/deacetylase ChbG (UPF0249 family)